MLTLIFQLKLQSDSLKKLVNSHAPQLKQNTANTPAPIR